VSVSEFIASQRTMFGIPHAIACRALEVSQSWFYKWINRVPTAREQRQERLDEEIKRLFGASGNTYGSPRITRDLREAGWSVSKNTVAARMAELGLCGRRPKRRRSLTRPGKRPAARDLVRRNFTAVAPDVLWCGDVTQIDTDEGPLYLATVEDLFSRRILGHAMSAHHDAALAVTSLQMAAAPHYRLRSPATGLPAFGVGMTTSPCRVHGPGGGVTSSEGTDRPLIRGMTTGLSAGREALRNVDVAISAVAGRVNSTEGTTT